MEVKTKFRAGEKVWYMRNGTSTSVEFDWFCAGINDE